VIGIGTVLGLISSQRLDPSDDETEHRRHVDQQFPHRVPPSDRAKRRTLQPHPI